MTVRHSHASRITALDRADGRQVASRCEQQRPAPADFPACADAFAGFNAADDGTRSHAPAVAGGEAMRP